MAKRKGISKKARFEVFKRDGFKCQYCGKSAPDVVLHVDHVAPVSKGGGNDPMNLITSCADCNLGKSDRSLDDGSVVAKQRAQLQELNERREQLEMMLKWREGLRELDDAAVDAVRSRFGELTGFVVNETGATKIRALLRSFSLPEVLDALEVAVEKYAQYEGEKMTIESASRALDKISGVAHLRSQPDEVRELYYARGILRNRISYCPDWRCIKLLRAAHEAGADVEDLKDVARDARNWSDFVATLEREWGVVE